MKFIQDKKILTIIIMTIIAVIGIVCSVYLLVKVVIYRNHIEELEDPSRDIAELNFYQDENKRLPGIQPGEKRIVFLGASITEQWDLNKYFPGINNLVNRGRNGQYAWQQLLRFKQDVVDIGTSIVIIKICAVNMRNNLKLDRTMDDVDMLLRLALTYNIRPIAATTLPVSEEFEKVDERNQNVAKRIIEYNNWLRRIAQNLNIAIIDYHNAMANENGYFRDNRLTSDGLHPTDDGYKIMAETARPILLNALGQIVSANN